MKIGDRLRQFAAEKFGNEKDLADAIGISPQHLSPYINNKYKFGSDILKKLSEVGCDINWLLTGKKLKRGDVVREEGLTYVSMDEALDKEIIITPEFPVAGDIPAGNYDFTQHDWPEYVKLDIDPREHFCLKIDSEYGYSMAPFIEPGDLVFCSRLHKEIKDGNLVVVRYDDTKGAIKKIIIDKEVKGTIGLESFNKAERTILLKKEKIKQIYKVVLIWKKAR